MIIHSYITAVYRACKEKFQCAKGTHHRYPDASLSNAGYAFIDIDDDGISELLISMISDGGWGAGDGMIYDLCTIQGGKVVHLVSSGERNRYYLCRNNIIANEGSESAWKFNI